MLNKLILLSLLFWAIPAAADSASGGDGSLVLILEDGVGRPSLTERESWDLELELECTKGKWQENFWAYAVNHNRADHPGRILALKTSGDTAVLDIELELRADRWSQPGKASYRVELRREGRSYLGVYTGIFLDRKVSGKASGKIGDRWWLPEDDFKICEAAEHPRLVFRKSELGEIRSRSRTPEGRAVVSRMLEVLGARADRPKLRSYAAAGYGFAYQLTGEVQYADRARRLLEEEVLTNFEGLVQDIHYGPYLLGVTLAFDFCYDAWDKEFRKVIVGWLTQRLRELATGMVDGKSMEGFNPNPWSNHNAIRMAAAGTAALAILREDGTDTEYLEELIHFAARDIRRHFRYGLGETGWFMEGDFYKKMTWNAGPGYFAQAYHKVTGGDLLAGRIGALTILGEWMEIPPLEGAPAIRVGDSQTSGLWPTGLVTVPREYRPAARWLYDRAFGLMGDRTFGIGWAHEAAYVLANYPFDSPAQPPGDVLPWAAPDFRKGHWIFRRPWLGSTDTLLTLHLNSESWRGCHYERIGETSNLQLWALGRGWLSGASVIDAGISNAFLGGKTTFFEADEKGRARLAVCLDDYYLQELARADGSGANIQGGEVATFRRAPRPFLDHGIRGRKSLFLDLSGECGAPVLLVWLDSITGAVSPVWKLGVAESAGPLTIEGNGFFVNNPSGASLKGTLLGDTAINVTGRIQATGAQQYLAVLTVQEGPPPEVTFQGSLPDLRIIVGKLTLRLDGEQFVVCEH
jgi:hypothetical protein